MYINDMIYPAYSNSSENTTWYINFRNLFFLKKEKSDKMSDHFQSIMTCEVQHLYQQIINSNLKKVKVI